MTLNIFFLWTDSITYLVPLVLNALCQGKVGEVGRGQPAASSGAHNKWNNYQIYRQSRPQLRSHPRLQAHPKSCFKAQERKSVMPNIVFMSSFMPILCDYKVVKVELKHEQVGLLQRCISLFTFAKSKLYSTI